MASKIIIVRSMNTPPEEEVNERVEELEKDGYKVVSATTTIAPFGEMASGAFHKVALHVYFVTTVVLTKE